MASVALVCALSPAFLLLFISDELTWASALNNLSEMIGVSFKVLVCQYVRVCGCMLT